MRVFLFLVATGLLQYTTASQLVMQSDDSIQEIFVDGIKQDQNGQGGSWQSVVDITINDNAAVISFKAKNNGGPGRVLMALDGQAVQPSQLKCFDTKANPSVDVSSYGTPVFDDSTWEAPVIIDGTWSQHMDQFPADIESLWTSNMDSNQFIVCRMVNMVPLKVRADNKIIELFVDGVAQDLNGNAQKWNSIAEMIVPASAKVVAFTAKNNNKAAGVMLSIGGVSTRAAEWRCVDLKTNKNVDLTGYETLNFDDSAFERATRQPAEYMVVDDQFDSFTRNTELFWTAEALKNQEIACRMVRGEVMPFTIQVDDKVDALYVDGVLQDLEGGAVNWQSVADIEIPANPAVIAFIAENWGGPGKAIVAVDDEPTSASDWKCVDVTANPSIDLTNIGDASFDDSAFEIPQVLAASWSQKLQEFPEGIESFWTADLYTKKIACRMVM